MMSEGPQKGRAYATGRLQQGFRLFDQGQDLSEEAVGFGLPVVKRGLHTLFPGMVSLTSEQSGSVWQVDALFTVNLEERLTRGSTSRLRSQPVYAAKDLLAATIRRSRALRSPLTSVSGCLRSQLGLRTVYDEADFRATVDVRYTIDSATGVMKVSLDASHLAGQGVTEVIVMNEQGGRVFDVYRDSAGRDLRGARIGVWDPVKAREASMVSGVRKLVYTVAGGNGATLYRGREVVGSRLAWSGFGYSFSPAVGKLEYVLRIARIP